MAKLSKSDLTQPATKDVTVPAWGGEVTIRSMTAGELQEYQRLAADEETLQKAMAYLVARCMVDPKFETADELMEATKPMGIMEVFQEIQVASGFGESAEDTKKNSPKTP